MYADAWCVSVIRKSHFLLNYSSGEFPPTFILLPLCTGLHNKKEMYYRIHTNLKNLHISKQPGEQHLCRAIVPNDDPQKEKKAGTIKKKACNLVYVSTAAFGHPGANVCGFKARDEFSFITFQNLGLE